LVGSRHEAVVRVRGWPVGEGVDSEPTPQERWEERRGPAVDGF